MHRSSTSLRPVAHRLVAVLAVAALVALIAGATLAFAGSTGGPGAPAYALVVTKNGTPQLIQSHTAGFVSVTVGPFGQGDYCLTPAPGVDIVDTAAVASEEAFYSNVAGFVTVRYPTSGSSCDANQLEVKTFDQTVTLTNQISFTVDVP